MSDCDICISKYLKSAVKKYDTDHRRAFNTCRVMTNSGLMEMAWQKTDFKALLNAVLLFKCLRAKLWENSRYVSRQLNGIGWYPGCY